VCVCLFVCFCPISFQLLAEEVPTLGGSSTSQVVVSEVQLPAPSVEILAPPLQQGSRSGCNRERNIALF